MTNNKSRTFEVQVRHRNNCHKHLRYQQGYEPLILVQAPAASHECERWTRHS